MKRTGTNRHETDRNEPQRKETKGNHTKGNHTKRSDTKRNETKRLHRTETDNDIEVRVSLPPGIKAKSVQLSVTKTAVTLGLKGREGPVLKVNPTWRDI